MTVRPVSRPPRQRVPGDVARRGAVYGIPTLPVDASGRVVAGPVVVGYVGQSRQTVKQREEQHRDSQPFSDLIVGGSWTIEEGWWTDAALDEREQYYIRNGVALVPGQPAQRPIYNHDHNLDNPKRIEIRRAVEHRQLRKPGWQPPPKDGHVSRQWAPPRTPIPPAKQPTALARWWSRRRWWVIGLAALWLALFAGCCRLVSMLVDDAPTTTIGAIGATAPFVLTTAEIYRRRVRAWWRRITRPKRRRRTYRGRR